MIKIAYTRAEDNGVSIVIPVPKKDIENILGPMTDDEYKAHIKERSIPENAKNVTYVSDEDLPNREFRDAWIHKDGKIVHDLDKAKNIHLSRIRAERDKIIIKYDGLQMKAMDTNNTEELEKIKKIKQALRDCTNLLKNSKPSSIDEIKKLTPNIQELTNG